MRGLVCAVLLAAAAAGAGPGCERIREARGACPDGQRGCRPALAGATLDGPALDAAALEGNTVLVNFWATWCDPCVREMPALQAVYDRHRADGFVVVGLLAGDRASDERVREFTRRMGVTYPVLRSSTEQQRRFEMRDSLPMSLLYDKTGRLRRRFEGGIKEHVLEGEVKEILR